MKISDLTDEQLKTAARRMAPDSDGWDASKCHDWDGVRAALWDAVQDGCNLDDFISD